MKTSKNNFAVESFQPLFEGLTLARVDCGPLERGQLRNTRDAQAAQPAALPASDSVEASPRSFVTTASEASHPVNAHALTRALSAPQSGVARKAARGQVTPRALMKASLMMAALHATPRPSTSGADK